MYITCIDTCVYMYNHVHVQKYDVIYTNDNFHMLTDWGSTITKMILMSGGPKRRETAQAGRLIVGRACSS